MRFLFPLSALLLASACAEPIDRSASSDEEVLPVEPDGGIGDGAEPLPTAILAIPEEMQGRWALVPADCTSTRGDAKGLIEVGEDSVQFYESKGTLDTIAEGEREPGTFRATYAFTGEGQEWSRDMQLAISDDGTEMVRSEFGEDALAEPLTYTKCGVEDVDDA